MWLFRMITASIVIPSAHYHARLTCLKRKEKNHLCVVLRPASQLHNSSRPTAHQHNPKQQLRHQCKRSRSHNLHRTLIFRRHHRHQLQLVEVVVSHCSRGVCFASFWSWPGHWGFVGWYWHLYGHVQSSPCRVAIVLNSIYTVIFCRFLPIMAKLVFSDSCSWLLFCLLLLLFLCRRFWRWVWQSILLHCPVWLHGWVLLQVPLNFISIFSMPSCAAAHTHNLDDWCDSSCFRWPPSRLVLGVAMTCLQHLGSYLAILLADGQPVSWNGSQSQI